MAIFDVMSQSSQCLLGKSKACHRSASEHRLQSFPTRNSGSIHPRQIRPSNSLRFNILSGGQSDGQEWIQRGCQSIWALSSSSKIILNSAVLQYILYLYVLIKKNSWNGESNIKKIIKFKNMILRGFFINTSTFSLYNS